MGNIHIIRSIRKVRFRDISLPGASNCISVMLNLQRTFLKKKPFKIRKISTFFHVSISFSSWNSIKSFWCESGLKLSENVSHCASRSYKKFEFHCYCKDTSRILVMVDCSYLIVTLFCIFLKLHIHILCLLKVVAVVIKINNIYLLFKYYIVIFNKKEK